MTFEMNRRHFLACSAAAATAAAGLPAHAAGVPRYRIADLGDLGGPTIHVLGLNNFGASTGMATRHGPDQLGMAFIARAGRMHHLMKWERHSSPSVGEAINDSGAIAGHDDRAWVWTHEAGLRIIASGPLIGRSAYDINSSGQVTGDAYNGDAYIDTHGSLQVIPRPDGFEMVSGRAINDHGHVAGSGIAQVNSSEVTRAFAWLDGTMVILDIPGASSHAALDINAGGQVCGVYWPADVRFARAFVWQDGRAQDLGVLGGERSSANALAINDAGTIVGTSTLASEDWLRRGARAAVWHDRVPYDLESLLEPATNGWSLYRATDINNRGQIVGQGSYKGVRRAFLATPIG